MKRINFNIKDRKMLYTMLSLVLVCVFTLTIAYSALSAVLTISGNARVSAANWDIYLNNPRVTIGSATTNLPEIKTSSTLEFETTLNMPGDFYEFVVDVVNGGDLDAMIENVVKTPDLTVEQAKFLKYEVSYQNGEAITTKQLLAKDTSMPIKVRVEYRKDLSNTDLPTGQVVLDLSLTLEYVQSDGSGTTVNNNGVEVKVVSSNGDINDIGTIVTIGSEQFYTIGIEGDNVKLLSIMNITFDDIPKQSSTPGYTKFSNISTSYEGSIVEEYVNNYNDYIITLGVTPVLARLITADELIGLGCNASSNSCSSAPKWVYSTSYWSGSFYYATNVWHVAVNGIFDGAYFGATNFSGVRPVIVISKDYFN